MAKTLGYENFITLAYYNMGRNDYTRDDVAKFRTQVKKSIVPIAAFLKEQQKKRLDVEDFKIYDDLIMFSDGNAELIGTPKKIMENGLRMYNEMSSETAEFINFMYYNELFDVLTKQGKAEGGHCTVFEIYKSPFIFANFNGTEDDINVLTHEAGHAFASYIAWRKENVEVNRFRSPTKESCEMHAMSMEFFSWSWLDLFFGDKADKYRYAHLSQAIAFIPYACMVDEFQHIIYEKTDLTPEQRCDEWKKLEQEYRPLIDAKSIPYYEENRRWQIQGHIYNSPFYYIDYCLAQMTALTFWAKIYSNSNNSPQSNEYREAWNSYMNIVKLAGTKKYTELLKAGDIVNPFIDNALEETAKTVLNWLQDNN